MHDRGQRGTERSGSPLPAGRFAMLLVAAAVVMIFVMLLVHR
jgi:hypothetical protein